jgi:hypothetical protein
MKLKLWQEAVGELTELEDDGNSLKLTLSCPLVLEFPSDSSEAEILRKELGPQDRGKRIAVLRTDLPGKPLIVRMQGADAEGMDK